MDSQSDPNDQLLQVKQLQQQVEILESQLRVAIEKTKKVHVLLSCFKKQCLTLVLSATG